MKRSETLRKLDEIQDLIFSNYLSYKTGDIEKAKASTALALIKKLIEG